MIAFIFGFIAGMVIGAEIALIIITLLLDKK